MKIQDLHQQELEEGAVADVARNLKAKVSSVAQKVKSAVTPSGSGGKAATSSFGAKQVKNEFETLCNLAISKANVEARSAHGNLSNQNVDPEELDEGMLDLLEKHVQAMAVKYRKGHALIVNRDTVTTPPRGLYKNVVHLFESPTMVKQFPDALATFWLISPLNPAQAAKGPYFTVTFDADLDQRIVSLQRLLDSNTRRVHPHQAAPAATAPAAAPASTAPVDPDADPTPPYVPPASAAPAAAPASAAPSSPTSVGTEPLSHDEVVQQLRSIWDEWKGQRKPALGAMRKQIVQMYRDIGGKGPVP